MVESKSTNEQLMPARYLREVIPAVRLVTSRAVFSQFCFKMPRDVIPRLHPITSQGKNKNNWKIILIFALQ